jgi:hypothetical protein
MEGNMHVLVAYLGFVESTKQRIIEGEEGLSTAELLGNAALAIGALVIIWGLLQALGVDIVNWIREQINID